jgi:hypothetical protein
MPHLPSRSKSNKNISTKECKLLEKEGIAKAVLIQRIFVAKNNAPLCSGLL